MQAGNLEDDLKLKEIEKITRKYWEDIDIKKYIKDKYENNETVAFVEGPPTLNGKPHIGHIRGRIIKDIWYRFNVLQDYDVIFRGGWDTQGLPVELQAEKELGLKGSKIENLKKIGEETLIQACKDLVLNNYETWKESDRLLGLSLDHDKAYWTYKDEYIEREWKYLEKAWENGILEELESVVPYCPSCQTSLSHAELAQGYENVEDPSLYYKVKLVDEDVYLVLWTTMPFTVVTDMLTGVKPKSVYSYVKVEEETWIVANERLNELMNTFHIENFEILKEVKGESLNGKKYIHPLAEKYIPELHKLSKHEGVHTIVAEDFVDLTTGTGLVHISPANGEIDFDIGKKRNLPLFNPINDQACFDETSGRFDGLFVRDANELVYDFLKDEKSLVKLGRLKHEYPLCWRSGHRLLWVARRAYFYRVDKLGDKAIDAAKSVEYYFEQPQNRFIEIIKEKRPWCISRERVWGTPLPIWKCTSCSHKIGLFSRKSIIEKAINLPDGENFELHKPWMDRILIKCPKCNNECRRELFVLDTWHNSGAAPYASLSDDEYDKLIPATFLTEGIDQTRGWAYTLLIENVIMKNSNISPYHAFLFQGHILDEKGNKMSKRLGNIVEGYKTLEENSVDVLRFYLMRKATPIDSLNFSFEEMKSRPYQVISTLYNLHKYLKQNGDYDNFNQDIHSLKWSIDNELLSSPDYWILSKLQNLINELTISYRDTNFNLVTSSIDNFIIESFSQIYLPMVRNEIWNDDESQLNRRLSIYSIISHILYTLDILLHPISPFITEYLYHSIFGDEPILGRTWPSVTDNLINDDLEAEFSSLQIIISQSNSARMKGKLKRRWPLKLAMVYSQNHSLSNLSNHKELLQKFCNIRNIEYIDDIDQLPITLSIFPNYEILGKKLKADIVDFRRIIKDQDALVLFKHFIKNESFVFTINNNSYEVMKNEIKFEFNPADDYVLSSKSGIVVVLPKERDSDLFIEGYIRDLARRIQSERKETGLDPSTMLKNTLIYGIEESTKTLLIPKLSELKYLIRTDDVQVVEDLTLGSNWKDIDIDGTKLKICIINS